MLSHDTDGSVLAAASSGDGDDGTTRVFDCVRHGDDCEPIGELEGTTQDPIFPTGAMP